MKLNNFYAVLKVKGIALDRQDGLVVYYDGDDLIDTAAIDARVIDEVYFGSWRNFLAAGLDLVVRIEPQLNAESGLTSLAAVEIVSQRDENGYDNFEWDWEPEFHWYDEDEDDFDDEQEAYLDEDEDDQPMSQRAENRRNFNEHQE